MQLQPHSVVVIAITITTHGARLQYSYVLTHIKISTLRGIPRLLFVPQAEETKCKKRNALNRSTAQRSRMGDKKKFEENYEYANKRICVLIKFLMDLGCGTAA